MADPATSVAAETAAAAGVVITLTGSIFGMEFDAIMAGFVGALVAQTLVHEQIEGQTALAHYWRGFIQLSAAGLLAGLLAPLAEGIAAGLLPVKVPAQSLHIAVAAIIGMVAPVVVPLLRRLASTFKGPSK